MSVKNKLIPELRFPEFIKYGEWKVDQLGNLSQEIIEKTKGRKYKLMSITSGKGLVSQIEKFGREIAGDSYKNYFVIHNEDFVYNKSSTKLYSEGEIAMYEDKEVGAVPNSIFTCFRFDKNIIYPFFAKYPFANNLHGNWLKKFIAIGARANGALQVNNKDLYSLPFPHPSLKEQQKIASCLSSLDELIDAHSNKLKILKEHKRGLMQNLFPAKGETKPKLRFKEFENDGEWKEWIVSEIGETINGLTGKRGEDFGRGNPYVAYKQVFDDSIIEFDKCSKVQIGENENQNYLQRGDILLTTSSETPNEVGFASVIVNSPNEKTYLNSFCFALRPFDLDITQPQFSRYLFHSNMYRSSITALAQGSTRYNISKNAFLKLKLLIPVKKEQQRIASCLNALDDMIIAQTEKTEQLKEYKKGLIQGLFPIIN